MKFSLLSQTQQLCKLKHWHLTKAIQYHNIVSIFVSNYNAINLVVCKGEGYIVLSQ